LQDSVATVRPALELTEMVAGVVVVPAHVATPAVAAALLIGAFTGSDETQVKLAGLATNVGTAHPAGNGPTKPTSNAC
jgi:hypothetical protein